MLYLRVINLAVKFILPYELLITLGIHDLTKINESCFIYNRWIY